MLQTLYSTASSQVIDDFAYEDVIEAHKENSEKIMPQIKGKVNEVAKELPRPPEGAIHFTHPKDLRCSANFVSILSDVRLPG